MISRREFFGRAATVAASALLVSRRAGAQQGMVHDSSIVRDSTNLFAMDQMAAKPVRLPPKPGAVPVLTDAQRDELEHHIHCQCGCTLDVFTCRTTDFSCQVSPAMHRDVMELVRGGYNAQEIIDAFVDTYGERALMAPKKSGFDLVAWFAPGLALLAGTAGLVVMLRRWGANANPGGMRHSVGSNVTGVDATPEELARLEAAIKSEERG